MIKIKLPLLSKDCIKQINKEDLKIENDFISEKEVKQDALNDHQQHDKIDLDLDPIEIRDEDEFDNDDLPIFE